MIMIMTRTTEVTIMMIVTVPVITVTSLSQ